MSVLGIYGYGKMGKSIQDIIADFSEISSYQIYNNENSITEFISKSDFIIDFSTPKGTNNLVTFLLNNPKPVLIGTTDLSDESKEKIEKLSKITPVMVTANVSLGANLVAKLAAKISSILGDDYDIDITDIHHKEKLDAPSGTAFMIADAINSENNNKFKIIKSRSDHPRREENEIGITSIRSANIPGEHQISFISELDSIELKHKITNRKLLANGAIKVALWLKNKDKGFYKMSDMFDL